MKDLVKVLWVAVVCPLLVLDFLFLLAGSAAWNTIAAHLMAGLTSLPLAAVKIGSIALLLALAGWGLSLSRDYAFAGAPDRTWWRDVRVWAVVVIVLEIIPYLVF
jgi:hypothetical protein